MAATANELDSEIEAYGYATDLIIVLSLSDGDKSTWNMQSEGMRRFVDGLTALAALECDDRGILIRRMLLAQGSSAVQNLVDALGCREVLLKCKSASALGSICMCPSAGATLMEQFGSTLLKRLLRMVQTKNRWAQGDACFVLGWIVRWANVDVVREIAPCVSKVCDALTSTFTSAPPTDTAFEPDQDRKSNLRIYPLILLLNLSQRVVLQDEGLVVGTLDVLFQGLLQDVEMDEGTTIAQLAVSLLVTLTHQSPEARQAALDRKLLPTLVRLSRRPFDIPDIADQLHVAMNVILSTR
ncbi:hypothetical protein Ae201684P_011087 [Aphanomyces euteiches]|uniref:Uncharacterized protein n=1 Tax=Aphanomyces euteiches TaxID=100861 RepID=A0A6G0XXF6_9STRA|nr:hypothetical protein Ae201684_000420 [Aphanomyces euteiches]KAH9091542.1 hypothetical protein Ae201684P_011087 [Aphanomyces euteiches]